MASELVGVSGATGGCRGCFNPQAFPFDAGMPFTEETMQKLLAEYALPTCDALSILGR